MCTLEKRGNLFILTLTGDEEHRLSPAVINSLLSALSKAKSQAVRGSALVTTAHGRFFSSGLDLAWAQAAGSSTARDRFQHLVDSCRQLVAAFLSLPMPTVAAVSGHAAGGGFLLALSHDYVLMRRDRAVLYLSEVNRGLTFPDYITALVRSKIVSASARRDILLGGRKVKGDAAVTMGIVDSAHDSAEGVVEAALRLGEQLAQRKWNGEVYAEIRKSLYPEVCTLLGLVAETITAPSKL